MVKESSAGIYFQQLMSRGTGLWQYLHDLPNSPNLSEKIETEWREFKGFERIDEKGAKAKWGEALSGFSNTEGGVLIWGIDARKNDGIDLAGDLAMREDPVRFAQMLKDIRLTSVDPALPGIEIEPITKSGETNGFVVCFVPEGFVKPYRDEVSKRFHVRIGDSFKVPGVSLLRSLFYSKTTALLVPHFAMNRDDDGSLTFELRIENRGNASASGMVAFVKVSDHLKLFMSPLASAETKFSVYDNRSKANFDGLRRELHPGLWIVAGHASSAATNFRDSKATIEISFFCRDTVPSRWKCEIDHYDVTSTRLLRKFVQSE